jgi:hypothetical protein
VLDNTGNFGGNLHNSQISAGHDEARGLVKSEKEINLDGHRQILFNQISSLSSQGDGDDLSQAMIAHDKGKPIAR